MTAHGLSRWPQDGEATSNSNPRQEKRTPARLHAVWSERKVAAETPLASLLPREANAGGDVSGPCPRQSLPPVTFTSCHLAVASTSRYLTANPSPSPPTCHLHQLHPTCRRHQLHLTCRHLPATSDPPSPTSASCHLPATSTSPVLPFASYPPPSPLASISRHLPAASYPSLPPSCLHQSPPTNRLHPSSSIC